MLDLLRIKKEFIGIGLCGMIFQAQAEVLVILPDSGPMARASNSIKNGIDEAYQKSNSEMPIKYVNSDQKRLREILKTEVSQNTKLIIGPLARQDVEAIMKEPLKIPVLALNEVPSKHAKVWQFSLSKTDDAQVLIKQIEKDRVQHLYILRESGTESESLSFVNAVFKNFHGKFSLVQQLPDIKSNEGVLLLGSMAWINSLKNKPSKRLYVQAFAIDHNMDIPEGTKFCDVPVMVQFLKKTNQTTENTAAFQRLNAFGQDVWRLADLMLKTKNPDQISIQGQTGHLNFKEHRIERKPACFEKTWFRLKNI
ncbi:penicillin-binding protein activator [Acinetobacter sp. YH16032]|uniref:penicillin-binding protein activator n=1 Tax=Acinetobacter sp. YH16032 TaxID=2601181 RepID=UPI0015D28E31|nr:penicillin-binding protein activator [Acinetobacter sp. YH16032]